MRYTAALLVALASTVGADSALKTTYRCMNTGAWFDVCSYENLCFGHEGPRDLVFINDDPTIHTHAHRYRIVATTKLLTDIRYPQPRRDTPFHYSASSVKTMKPSQLAALKDKVKWYDTPTYIPSYFEKLGNIWYYSSRVLPLFNVQQHPEWDLPPMEHVIMPAVERKVDHDWHKNVMRLSVQPDTKVFYNSDAPYHGLVNADVTHCFKKVVLLGAAMYGFDSMMSAYKFREKAWAQYNITVPKVNKPPQNITLLDRGSKRPRHFLNAQDMMEVISKYNVTASRVIIENDSTFQQQVEMMANTGVLVTMHGAGLMNEMFLPPGAAVIEIFPVHLKHVLYERVAHYAGVYHFKVYCQSFAKGFHAIHQDYLKYKCDRESSLSISDNANCWMAIKNANVVTPMKQFEVALVHAMDHSAWRTKLIGEDGFADHSTDDGPL